MRRKLDKAEVAMLKADLENGLQLRFWEPGGHLVIEDPVCKVRYPPRPLLALFGYLSLAGSNAIVFETQNKQYEYGQGTDLEPVSTELWSRKED